MKPVRRVLVLGVVAVAAVAVAGIGYATIPGSNGVIQGCYDTGGNLKVVNALPCPKGYTSLPWNQQGVKGDKGDTGVKGDTGDKGDTGAPGPSQVYYAQHEHVVESQDTRQEVVGLTLPAGKYLVTTAVHSGLYTTSSDVFGNDLECSTTHGAAPFDVPVDIGHDDSLDGTWVEKLGTVTDTFTLTLGVSSPLVISCVLGFNSDDAALGVGRITALQVSAIN